MKSKKQSISKQIISRIHIRQSRSKFIRKNAVPIIFGMRMKEDLEEEGLESEKPVRMTNHL